MQKIPLVDLTCQWSQLRDDLLGAVERVLARGQYILGQEVEGLEREVAAYCGTTYGVAVGNGTDALTLALHAYGITAGDEVITTPFSFFATVEAILQVGAVPVFADVDERTFTLTPETVAPHFTPRTRAIVPVHLFGLMADMQGLRELADDHGVILIEDACQAIGASWNQRGVGAYGDAAALSFFPTKNLGGYGDGGMILLSDGEKAERLRRLRAHGSVRKYVHEEKGWNSRLDELQAAMLRVKLTQLTRWTDERRALAARYNEAFSDLPVTVPYVPAEANHVYHLYTVLVDRRDELQAALLAEGVQSGIYYPVPLHLQRAVQHLGYRGGDCPVAERLSKRCLSLPLYPGMDQTQQDRVIAAVRRFFARS